MDINPRSVDVTKVTGDGDSGILYFNNEYDEHKFLIHYASPTVFLLQNLNVTHPSATDGTTIRLLPDSVNAGLGGFFDFSHVDGGTIKGRILWRDSSNNSHYFYTTTHLDTLYAALSDYNTHVADVDAHHNEDHDHDSDSIDPSDIFSIGSAGVGLFGSAASPLTGLVLGAGGQVINQAAGILTFEEMDVVIEDGKKLILYDASGDDKIEFYDNGTNSIIDSVTNNLMIQKGSVNKMLIGTNVSVVDGTILKINSSGDDKQLFVYHSDVNAHLDVPAGDGDLVIVTDQGTGNYTWRFNNNGILTIPIRAGDPANNGEICYNSTTDLLRGKFNGNVVTIADFS